ncbi:ARID2 AT-rich interaction domain protein [Giardia muris]|uniref:ARID2 AT-rich interaction domain protein n=1 Tax=Giardia muris TaxID=5742 RepID=A0A4Z1TBH0_GIAMU|nr:ARID2 AT-rich interaction domain protein [Giardia muris]|eukprot:TNJ30597.1 ARID2 AT-rich interaction domain protein [Giardia muris]
MQSFTDRLAFLLKKDGHDFPTNESFKCDGRSITYLNLFAIYAHTLRNSHFIKWRLVADKLGVSRRATSASTILKQKFERYLSPYLGILMTEFPDLYSEERISQIKKVVSGADSPDTSNDHTEVVTRGKRIDGPEKNRLKCFVSRGGHFPPEILRELASRHPNLSTLELEGLCRVENVTDTLGRFRSLSHLHLGHLRRECIPQVFKEFGSRLSSFTVCTCDCMGKPFLSLYGGSSSGSLNSSMSRQILSMSGSCYNKYV